MPGRAIRACGPGSRDAHVAADAAGPDASRSPCLPRGRRSNATGMTMETLSPDTSERSGAEHVPAAVAAVRLSLVGARRRYLFGCFFEDVARACPPDPSLPLLCVHRRTDRPRSRRGRSPVRRPHPLGAARACATHTYGISRLRIARGSDADRHRPRFITDIEVITTRSGGGSCPFRTAPCLYPSTSRSFRAEVPIGGRMRDGC